MDTDDYMAWEKQALADIGKDTDALLGMLGEKSMGESFDSGLLTGMMRNGDGLNGGNGMWLLVLFLLILGRGNGLFGGSAEDVAKNSTLVNETNYSRLMEAISTQGTRQEVAIGNLASAVGSNFGDVKLALSGLDSKLCQCGSDIKSAIQECCCRTNLNIERGNNAVIDAIQAQTLNLNNYMAAQNLDRERQTNQIVGAIANQTTLMQQGFCDIKERELLHQVEDLKARLLEQSQAAQTAQIIAAVNGSRAVSGTLNTTAGTWEGTSTS